MTQNNDHDFQQFRGAFDDAMIPDAEFKAKMEKMLQREVPVSTDRASTVLASPPQVRAATVVPARRSSPLMVAVAVLTVFAVVVASVWVLSGDVLEGQYANAPSGIATMPADAPGTPGPDVQLNMVPIPSVSEYQWLVGVYQNVLISTTSVHSEDPFENLESTSYVTAQEATSGEILWQLDRIDLGYVTHSDGILVGVEYDFDTLDEFGRSDRSLIAIDLMSGRIIWEAELESPDGETISKHPSHPLIIDGTVVVADPSGEIHNMNLYSGEQMWRTEFDPGRGEAMKYSFGDGPVRDIILRSIAAADWQGQLVMVNGDGLVQLFEVSTGSLVDSYSLAGDQNSRFTLNQLELHSVPSGVLLVRDIPSNGGSQSELVVFDPLSGEKHWASQFDGWATVVTASDGTLAVQTQRWESSSWLMQLLGNHGHTTSQFLWIDSTTGEELLATEHGRIQIIREPMTNGTYACVQLDEFVCFDQSGTRHLLDLKDAGVWVISDDALFVRTDAGIYRADLP